MSQQDPNNAGGSADPNQNPYGQPMSQPPPTGQYPPQPPLPQVQPGQPAYGYPPQPPQPLSPSDERLWGMLSYLLGLLVGFLAPLIIFLVYKERSRFVRETSREALNLQITAAIVYVVATIGMFTIGAVITVLVPPAGFLMFIIWFILLMVYAIAVLVFQIIGAVRANNGIVYQIPFILRLVK